MARPKKQTIEYFPHFVNHHKTMFVLESKFGNDGYAFWFKVLELLGNTNGMYYDCNNVADWEFLLAKTHLNSETANNILDTLADLDAIDKELWDKQKIIWSQNLVDNVRDAFKKRITEMPQKPVIEEKTPVNVEFSEWKPPLNEVSGDGNGERKEKERKEKESKRESNNSFRTENYQLNNINDNKNKINSLSLDKNIIELCKYYEKLKPGESIAAHIPKLQILINEYGMDWVKDALEKTIKNKNKFILSYIEGILRNWKLEGKEELNRDGPNIGNNQSNNRDGEIEYDFSKYGG
ncbi:DnaD and phage-associated domain-containing protein [Caloramator quimbayensis]|uniref:DnaD and phage-associated domain-containing protein n=1 Tax=Caloramator quimbayensis TaxID=1147123 RepID=A0A1T4YH03_9CLOT|nr:Lin1244/Lin1753 domain-containing protein [Caloramator quimbayensis]SKB01049.1 DnaD and phage-associated domain-containing protein [Caloramator quimbayensis]